MHHGWMIISEVHGIQRCSYLGERNCGQDYQTIRGNEGRAKIQGVKAVGLVISCGG